MQNNFQAFFSKYSNPQRFFFNSIDFPGMLLDKSLVVLFCFFGRPRSYVRFIETSYETIRALTVGW